MDEINERSFASCFAEAKASFERRQLPIGISFDLDGLDPHEIAAVGTPEAQGLQLNEVIAALATLDRQKLIGLELTEYNPLLDTADHHAIHIIKQILEAFLPDGSLL